MVGRTWRCTVLAGIAATAFCYLNTARAEEAVGSKETSPLSAANSNLQREYARLAQLLNSDDVFGKREAAESLLKVRPGDVASADTRKLIARGYRSVAMAEHGPDKNAAIQGLVIWGGKYSVPVLIDLLEREQLKVPAELFDGLATLKDPRGAEAVSRQLGNFFNHDAAVRALRKMGATAEETLIKAAPSNDARVSLSAIELLGEVGTENSLELLAKAAKSRNPEVREAAKLATKSIRERSRKVVPQP